MRQLFWQNIKQTLCFLWNQKIWKTNFRTYSKFLPFYVHQFAIPNFELNRLITKYENWKANNNLNPSLVLIDLKKNVINEYNIDQIITAKYLMVVYIAYTLKRIFVNEISWHCNSI